MVSGDFLLSIFGYFKMPQKWPKMTYSCKYSQTFFCNFNLFSGSWGQLRRTITENTSTAAAKKAQVKLKEIKASKIHEFLCREFLLDCYLWLIFSVF